MKRIAAGVVISGLAAFAFSPACDEEAPLDGSSTERNVGSALGIERTSCLTVERRLSKPTERSPVRNDDVDEVVWSPPEGVLTRKAAEDGDESVFQRLEDHIEVKQVIEDGLLVHTTCLTGTPGLVMPNRVLPCEVYSTVIGKLPGFSTTEDELTVRIAADGLLEAELGGELLAFDKDEDGHRVLVEAEGEVDVVDGVALLTSEAAFLALSLEHEGVDIVEVVVCATR